MSAIEETPKPRESGLRAAVEEAFGRPWNGAPRRAVGGRPPVTAGPPAAAPPPVYARARKPRPTQRVSAVVTLPLFAYHSARQAAVIIGDRGENPDGFDIPDALLVARETPAVWAARGAPAILERLAKLGVRFEILPSGDVIPVSEAGFIVPELRLAIESVWPLIRGHLTGRPFACGLCGEPAVDVAVGGVGLCMTHSVETGVEA